MPIDDPFWPDEGETRPAKPLPSPEEQRQLADKWRGWLDNPDNSAALMQAGIALMQPMGFGQTPIGHFGNALGEAGEAMSRRAKQTKEDAEAESKMQARERRAEDRERRAGIAEQNAGLSSQRAQNQLTLGLIRQHQQMVRDYETAKKNHEANQPVGVARTPFMSWPEYLKSRGASHLEKPFIGRADEDDEDTPEIPATSGARPQPPAAAIEYLRKNPKYRADFDAKFGAGAAAKVLGM